MAATVDTMLDRAEAQCARRGAQLTELRRQVLRLVLEAEQPVGAYALLDKLRTLRGGAAPPTVYRALDFLLEQGLIHKVERLNAFLGCVEAGQAGGHAHHREGDRHDHPHQFLICRACGATAEISDPAITAALASAAAKAGFILHQATVEAEGVCAACAAAAEA